LVFGGSKISFIARKSKFEVKSTFGGENIIYETDFNDAMVFIYVEKSKNMGKLNIFDMPGSKNTCFGQIR
jgi:hypothetical protein